MLSHTATANLNQRDPHEQANQNICKEIATPATDLFQTGKRLTWQRLVHNGGPVYATQRHIFNQDPRYTCARWNQAQPATVAVRSSTDTHHQDATKCFTPVLMLLLVCAAAAAVTSDRCQAGCQDFTHKLGQLCSLLQGLVLGVFVTGTRYALSFLSYV